ncbi:MAG TPA: mechanosensitive ion channel family protein [Rhodothermales bacterium]
MNLPFDIVSENQDFYGQLLLTLIVLVASFLIVRFAQRTILRFVDEPHRRYRISKLVSRIGGLLTIAAIVVIWSPDPSRFVTILSVIGAGLAIANREAILSLAGRLNIALRAPFVQGDRIEVNGVIGDVIDIRLIQTSLMEVGGWVHADQSTGRLVHIPNSWVLQFGVYNYTQGFSFIWNELPITITTRSDWEAAREIMLSLAQETAAIVEHQVSKQILRMSREYLVHYSILTPFVYVRIVPEGICLSLRYLCEARKRRGTEHALTVSILKAFREHGNIELAAEQGLGSDEEAAPQERKGPLPRPFS